MGASWRRQTTKAVSSDILGKISLTGVGHGELKRAAICEPEGRGHRLIRIPVADWTNLTASGNDMDVALLFDAPGPTSLRC